MNKPEVDEIAFGTQLLIEEEIMGRYIACMNCSVVEEVPCWGAIGALEDEKGAVRVFDSIEAAREAIQELAKKRQDPDSDHWADDRFEIVDLDRVAVVEQGRINDDGSLGNMP